MTLFIFGFIYQFILVFDALRLKNTIQIIGLCVCNLGFLIYAAVQMNQIRDAVLGLKDSNQQPSAGRNEAATKFWRETRPFLTAIPCVIAVGSICMSFVAWKLYNEFAWTIYKNISADLRLKRRYLAYQIYIALLKFDFFFFLGFTVQFLVIVINNDTKDYEFGLTIAAIPVTIAILFLAAYWTRKENRAGMLAIITLYFAALAYFLFKLIRMYQPKQVVRYQKYRTARRPLTTFAVITLVLIVTTIVNACVCMHNFGAGLKQYISKPRVEKDEEKVKMTERPSYAQGPMPSRMIID